MTAGESDLQLMLRGLDPALSDHVFVFHTFPGAIYGHCTELNPLASIVEPEGLTLIVDATLAENAGLAVKERFACISLGLHSSLDAVGLTAAVSAALAEEGISANMFAGYFHDHILVPEAYGAKALQVLHSLAGSV